MQDTESSQNQRDGEESGWKGLECASLYIGMTLLVILFIWRLKRMVLYRLANLLPGTSGLPLLGHSLSFFGRQNSFYKKIYEEDWKDVMKLWIGKDFYVFLSNPIDIELVLKSEEHIGRSPEYSFFEPWLGVGLHAVSGMMWWSHRKAVGPAFHPAIIQAGLPEYSRAGREAVLSLAKSGRAQVDLYKTLGPSLRSSLLRDIMGDDKTTREEGRDYIEAASKLSEILEMRHSWLHLRFGWSFLLTKYKYQQERLIKTVQTISRKVVRARQAEYKKNGRTLQGHPLRGAEETRDQPQTGATEKGEGRRPWSFTDYMIDSSEYGVLLNDTEIKNQIDCFMYNGLDTTVLTCCYFLSMMAARQDIQEKCYKELKGIFGDSDRDVTLQDTLKMKYLELCLMETLRLFPPVPAVARNLQADLKLASNGATVPAGTNVVVAVLRTHRRSDFFPKPLHFDPERFTPEACARRHYYSFLPFSAGPRACLGRRYAMLKMKAVLSQVLRRYRLHPGLAAESDPGHWSLEGVLSLRPATPGAFDVHLEERTLL